MAYTAPTTKEVMTESIRLAGPGPDVHTFWLSPEAQSRQDEIYGDIAGAQSAEIGALGQYVERTGQLEDVLGRNAAALARAGRLGRRAITQEAARGMAGAMGQAGAMPIGGGGAAMLRQQGLESGQRRAEFGAQQSLMEAQQALTGEEAMLQALLGQAQAQERIGAIRREEADRRKQGMQEIQDAISGLKEKYSNIFETDTVSVSRDLAAMATSEPDPFLREYIMNEAARIRNTPMNMFTIE
tara:strand:+ start:2692 stop:3417 length:726 start_codon:yes stop_codon:yes gene_type:complete